MSTTNPNPGVTTSSSNSSPSSKIIIALGGMLNLTPEVITKALNLCHAEDGYERFEYPKGNGKVRVIHAPIETLKITQRAILDRLLSQSAVTPFAHGFVPHRSIITNALVHAPSARSILSLDLKDAFPSVLAERIKKIFQWRIGVLIKLNAPQLNKLERQELCSILAQLCTRDGCLPQGAPTSGYLLNLACARLDRLIYSCALKSRLPQIKYTRYADDITLTSSAPIPPEFVAEVKGVITRSGFSVNPLKVHTYSDTQKALVICGIRIFNQGLALPKVTVKKYRAHLNEIAQKELNEVTKEEKARVLGILSFLRSIYATPPKSLQKPLTSLLAKHSSWLSAPKIKKSTRFTHYSYQEDYTTLS